MVLKLFLLKLSIGGDFNANRCTGFIGECVKIRCCVKVQRKTAKFLHLSSPESVRVAHWKRDGRDMETTATRFIKQKFHLEHSAVLQ